MENEKPSQVAGTTSEENSETLESTTFVSSDQLSGLDNEHIAFLLYHLVDNGTDKSFEELYHIGNTFGVIAANLRR